MKTLIKNIYRNLLYWLGWKNQVIIKSTWVGTNIKNLQKHSDYLFSVIPEFKKYIELKDSNSSTATLTHLGVKDCLTIKTRNYPWIANSVVHVFKLGDNMYTMYRNVKTDFMLVARFDPSDINGIEQSILNSTIFYVSDMMYLVDFVKEESGSEYNLTITGSPIKIDGVKLT